MFVDLTQILAVRFIQILSNRFLLKLIEFALKKFARQNINIRSRYSSSCNKVVRSQNQDVFARLVPSGCDKSETSCFHLITRLMMVTDLLLVVPARLMQAVCCYELVAINLLTTCYVQTISDLLLVCWPHQPCYKMITACYRLVNTWKQTVETNLVDKLRYF